MDGRVVVGIDGIILAVNVGCAPVNESFLKGDLRGVVAVHLHCVPLTVNIIKKSTVNGKGGVFQI